MHFKHLIVVAIGSVVVVSLAHAQQLTDSEKGRILARQVCAECHDVGLEGLPSPNSQAPSFVAVASTPGMTGDGPQSVLRDIPSSHAKPHSHTRSETGIIAYILSLRR
jgi:hypothetical protein